MKKLIPIKLIKLLKSNNKILNFKFFKIDLKGVTRIVFISQLKFLPIVIKIPNFLVQHNHFLHGCYSNYSERFYYKLHKNVEYENNMTNFVAPSYFCSYFSLLQIQAKCEPKLENLTEEEKKFFESLCGTDNKKENFGWYKNKLVCLDYP